jgi:hypothetical protein
MDLIDKLDIMLSDTTVAGDVATNTAKGHIDVIGGKCPDGQVYDKIKKVCVPVKNESGSVSAMVAGSGQTRTVGRKNNIMPDLARKNPETSDSDDPTERNLDRMGLKFNVLLGAYVPEKWGK